jgi:hypothetical protein
MAVTQAESAAFFGKTGAECDKYPERASAGKPEGEQK